jgi:hypothetical protein
MHAPVPLDGRVLPSVGKLHGFGHAAHVQGEVEADGFALADGDDDLRGTKALRRGLQLIGTGRERPEAELTCRVGLGFRHHLTGGIQNLDGDPGNEGAAGVLHGTFDARGGSLRQQEDGAGKEQSG